MKHRKLVLSAVFGLVAAPLTAQADFGAVSHQLPGQIDSYYLDSNVDTFLLTVKGFPNSLWGGSLRTTKLNRIDGTTPFNALQIGRLPFVVQEGNSGTYYGLNYYGEFAKLALPAAATTTSLSEHVMGMIEGSNAHVFGQWSTSWRTVPLATNKQVFLTPARACVVLQDGDQATGTTLYGFSMFFEGPTRPAQPATLTVPAGRTAAFLKGAGESDSRRNMQAFEISTPTLNQIAIYSAYTNAWRVFTFQSGIGTLTLCYNKNVLGILDPTRNTVWFYSAHTSTMTSRTWATMPNILCGLVFTQDFGVYVPDTNGDVTFYRGIDGGIATLTGKKVAALDKGGAHSNNVLALIELDAQDVGIDVWACSSSKRGAQFVNAGLGAGETILDNNEGDDMTFVLPTDKSVYGFSAFSNKWTKFADYKGTYKACDGEDMFGWVETDTHVYIFSPREDKWIEHAKAPNFSRIYESLQYVVIAEGTRHAAYGMDGMGYRVTDLGGPTVFAFAEATYFCAVTDNPRTGGSTVHVFRSWADTWSTIELRTRITTANTARLRNLENGLVVLDGSKVHVVSACGDLSTDYAAPSDNTALHATPGSKPIFVANGKPGAIALMLLGTKRVDVPAPPPFSGSFLVDLATAIPVVVPPAVFGPDGTMRFQLDLTNVPPLKLAIQMIGLDTSGFDLGRLMVFESF